ncbi:MAG: hypothetical protein R3193_17360, partial [Marinobacter sp.]|nr:hypothetical protein [Marinobacter sp.]
MANIYIAAQAGTSAANTNKTWNSFSTLPTTAAALAGSAITFRVGTGFSTTTSPENPGVGTGNAAWVDEVIIAAEAWFVGGSNGANADFFFENVPAGTYTVKVFCYRGATNDRSTQVTVAGSPITVTADDLSEAAIFTGVSPDGSGVILGNIQENNGSDFGYVNAFALEPEGSPTPTVRKGSQFDVETTLSGTVTAATLNGNAITVDSQAGTTVTLTDSGSAVTTSGEYNLVLTDDSADPDETIVVQVNVYGVAPSNNPLQKDGSALASLTGVQLRVTAGANLNGSELYYSGTGTTDASGNLGNIDLSSTAAADTDPVLLHMRT